MKLEPPGSRCSLVGTEPVAYLMSLFHLNLFVNTGLEAQRDSLTSPKLQASKKAPQNLKPQPQNSHLLLATFLCYRKAGKVLREEEPSANAEQKYRTWLQNNTGGNALGNQMDKIANGTRDHVQRGPSPFLSLKDKFHHVFK